VRINGISSHPSLGGGSHTLHPPKVLVEQRKRGVRDGYQLNRGGGALTPFTRRRSSLNSGKGE
jgi:hypothetical protein